MPGWKSVRNDIEDVVEETKKTHRLSAKTAKKYSDVLKKVLFIALLSSASAALLWAGFRRHRQLYNDFLNVSKKTPDKEVHQLANVVRQEVSEKRTPKKETPKKESLKKETTLPFSTHHRSIYKSQNDVAHNAIMHAEKTHGLSKAAGEHMNRESFTRYRFGNLKAHLDEILKLLERGELNVKDARERMWSTFRHADPPNIREALMTEYSTRANALQGIPRSRWAKTKGDPERVYKKYSL